MKLWLFGSRKNGSLKETEQEKLSRGKARINQLSKSLNTARVKAEASRERYRQEMKSAVRTGKDIAARRLASQYAGANQHMQRMVNLEDHAQGMRYLLDTYEQQLEYAQAIGDIGKVMADFNLAGQEEARKLIEDTSIHIDKMAKQIQSMDDVISTGIEGLGGFETDQNIDTVLQEIQAEVQAEAEAEADLQRRVGLDTEERQ